MRTITKTFQFATPGNLEQWVPHTQNGGNLIAGHHRGKNRGTRRNNPPASNLRGCVRMTAKQSSISSSNYWEWTGSWENLGIDPGANVLSASMDYMFRWEAYAPGGTNTSNKVSSVTFANTASWSGPSEFTGSSFKFVFQTSSFCIARTAGNLWNKYPVGSPGNDPLSINTPAWGHSYGKVLGLSGSVTASNTQLSFKIWNHLPKMPAIGGGSPSYFLRHKNDAITITMVTDQEPITASYADVPIILFSD
jgi:hypothetical protein